MGVVPLEERYRRLMCVLEAEGLEARDSDVRAFAARETDLRQMLLTAQQSFQVDGRLLLEPRSDSNCQLLAEIIAEPEYSIDVQWDLKPFTAPGRLTLLCARPKLGKSTLVAHYVAKKVIGGDFLGQPLEAGPVLWVSGPEENKYDITRRFHELGMQDEQIHVFHGLADIHAIAAKAAEVGAALVVLDTLARIAGIRGESDNAAWVLWSNEALPVIRDSCIPWIGIHHNRKAGGDFGEAIRGASAIFGLVDIALSLHGGCGCRRRKLKVDGTRFETPDHDLLIELRDGDYVVAGYVAPDDPDDEGHGLPRAALVALEELRKASEPITRDEFVQQLTARGYEVSASTLYDHLNMLRRAGFVQRVGAGQRGDPHRWVAVEEDSFGSV